MSAPLPYRPRIAETALPRRQITEGNERFVLYDTLAEEALEIDERQWQLLSCADGTRDLDGIVLAASRLGAYRRASELVSLLSDLAQRGLLASGIAASPAPSPRFAERPIEVLPFSLTCDQNGSCCRTYSSVRFRANEARKALSLCPDVLGGADSDRVFLPSAGSVSEDRAVTMVDGACAFLAGSGGCRLHEAGGDAAKPRGCSLFPATFVDDGEAVRVSVSVECPCVLASVGQEEGAPLASKTATNEGDLPEGAIVVRLPEGLRVTSERVASRSCLRAFSDAVLAANREAVDSVALLWTLANALEEHGLSAEAAEQALVQREPPTPEAIAPWIEALAKRAQEKAQSAKTFRAEKDRTRVLSSWLSTAAKALCETASLEAALRPTSSQSKAEAFYVEATLFGHHLVGPDLTLQEALRDRATRLVLARQMAARPIEQGDPSEKAPIAAVEAMMRGQALARYASEVGS